MTEDQPLSVNYNGVTLSLGMASTEPLVRAVIISLFSWRRANADDDLPGNERMGWWGDTTATIPNDRIGSRLWLLDRSKITSTTIARAIEYAQEALAWLIADGVASDITVTAERLGIDTVGMLCVITKPDGSQANVQFSNVWSFLDV